MDIPFVDLKRQLKPLMPKIQAAMNNVIERCKFIGGPEVNAFEKQMARWLGVSEVCGTSSGTSSITLTLQALGIGRGDEVITAPNTDFATSEAINNTGANVVFADITPGYFNLDPQAAERAITPKTRAVIPVHLFGIPADMGAFTALGKKHNLHIIEDCAQAQGARWDEQQVGSIATAGVFSFYPTQTLGAFGDGGAVASSDPELIKKVRMLANHGRRSKYTHEIVGTNSRLDTLKAAQLSICLENIDQWNQERRDAADLYNELLEPYEAISRPQVPADSGPVWHLYVIRHKNRDGLASFLKEKGINTGLHYPLPLHRQPVYRNLGFKEGSLPEAESACREVLSLPMFPKITPEEIKAVVSAIAQFLGRRKRVS